jgi:hypothetical protein
MGEVYRADDIKLGREVALKLLPEALAKDTDRLARFEREARVLASLSHPNIGAIYGLEKADSGMFLVLELAEGRTLRQRMAEGLSLRQVLEIFHQIAQALEVAREGVVHPTEARETYDYAGGRQVLDFGLARRKKARPGEPADGYPPPLTSPRVESFRDVPMSPEQARIAGRQARD